VNYIDDNNNYFRKSAKYYDRNTRIIASFREKLFLVAEPQQGEKILDVATGTGAVALTFAKHDFETTGIDLSEDMLAEAAKKKQQLPVTFLKADASRLPFGNQSFDIVTVSFALHDMPLDVRKQAVKEMYRVLKADGRLVIMDYAKPKNIIWRKIATAIINLYEELSYKQFLETDLYSFLKQERFHISYEERLLCGAAGLWVCTKHHSG
jgi:demethylmenaquinone methyltransferase/2-methoxy-6-polyprenyl-1,4-benzoquinol methylase